LPQGDYRFRSNLNGTQFWSEESSHCALPGCESTAVTVTIPLTMTVQSSGVEPYPDLPVYAFDGDTYIGYHGTMGASGEVELTLPESSYRFSSAHNRSDWILRRISLEGYRGETVRIRFRGVQGDAWTSDTWIIDDVRIGERESQPDLGFPFNDDMETGDSSWEPDGQWVLVDDDPHSPEHAWSMNPDDGYQRNTDFALKLAGLIDIPSGAVDPKLTYYDRIEAASDTMLQIEVTTNEGFDWIVLQTFSAADNTADWMLREIALTDYIGETIGIRCRSIQGSSWSVDSWLIDDVWVGDDAPAPTASPTPTDTATATAIATAIATASATSSSTPEASATEEGTETPTPTATPEVTSTPTPTPTPSPTPTPTHTPTSLASNGSTGSVVLAAIAFNPVGENTSSMPAPAPQAGEVVTRVIDYSYDPLYRLTAADYDDGTFFHYTYDAVGNRITQETLAGMNNYVYDIANRLIEVDGVSYTWDANGNLLNDGMRTYTYNHANRLTGVAQGDDNYTFAYNGLGDRLQQAVNGVPTNYSLDINRVLTQVLAEETNTYLYGNGRIGEEQAGGWQMHLGDALGSVRQLSGPDVTLTFAQSYTPFGQILASAGSGQSVFQYTGEARDGTGLTFLRARYLDTGAGRFINRDTWGGDYKKPLSLNRWNYVEANPIIHTDPSGHICLDPWAPAGFHLDLNRGCDYPKESSGERWRRTTPTCLPEMQTLTPTPGPTPSQRFDKIIFICGVHDGTACADGSAPLHPFREWAERIGYSKSDFSIYDIDRCSGKAKLDCANQVEAEIESSGSARFLLIGHSAGGSAVIIAADRVSDKGRIAGIVLLDPSMNATLEGGVVTNLQTMADSLPKPVFLGDSPKDGPDSIAGAYYVPYPKFGHAEIALKDEVVNDMLKEFGWSELR
jgi:RHS repeat-associated protein